MRFRNAYPEMTDQEKWLRYGVDPLDYVFIRGNEVTADDMMFPHVVVIGYGVRDPRYGWDVFLTIDEANEAFEYLADGMVFDSEVAA